MARITRTLRLLGPLLEDNPDLRYAGGMVVMLPIRHIFRGIVLDKSSSKGVYTLLQSICCLFVPRITPSTAYGPFDPVADRTGYFDLPDARQSELTCATLSRITLPFFRLIDGIEEHYLYRLHGNLRTSPAVFDHFLLEAAMGHFDQAMAIARLHGASWRAKDPTRRPGEQALCDELCVQIDLIESGDRHAFAAHLRALEQQSARNCGVEHLWEPSPFPFEEGYSRP